MQAKDSIPRVILLGRLCLFGRQAERLHEELVPVAARWADPARRRSPLRAYAREAETRTLVLLDEALKGGGGGERGRSGAGCWPRRLATSTSFARRSNRAPRNSPRPRNGVWPSGANGRAGICTTRCSASASAWSRNSPGAKRTTSSLPWHSRMGEMRQLDADMRHWRRRLAQFEQDLEREPARIREFYEAP